MMIALKLILALLFGFLLFIGAFMAISSWIFDRVEISDHMERMKLQEVRAKRNADKRKQKRIY
jgi:hypothetical protein